MGVIILLNHRNCLEHRFAVVLWGTNHIINNGSVQPFEHLKSLILIMLIDADIVVVKTKIYTINVDLYKWAAEHFPNFVLCSNAIC